MSQTLFPSQSRFIRKSRRNLPKVKLVQAPIPAIPILNENPAKSQKTQTNKHTHTHKRSTARRQLDREVCVSKSAAMFQNNNERISRLFEGNSTIGGQNARGSNGAMEYSQDGQRLQNMPDGRRGRARGFDDSTVENWENGMDSSSLI
jgi:hypothetical protein